MLESGMLQEFLDGNRDSKWQANLSDPQVTIRVAEVDGEVSGFAELARGHRAALVEHFEGHDVGRWRPYASLPAHRRRSRRRRPLVRFTAFAPFRYDAALRAFRESTCR